MDASRRPPPPGVVAAAEQDYHAARDDLAKLINATRTLVDDGHSELKAVTDVYLTLRLQQHSPIVLLVAAAAIVRLAMSPQPSSTPRQDKRPHTETR